MTKRQIEIPDETWRQVRTTAYQQGTTATALVNVAITSFIGSSNVTMSRPLPDMSGPEQEATEVVGSEFVRPFNAKVTK